MTRCPGEARGVGGRRTRRRFSRFERRPRSTVLDQPTELGPFRIIAASATHTGHWRSVNEDRCVLRLVAGKGLVVAVVDGMGGHGRGELAAELVAEELALLVESLEGEPERLREQTATALSKAELSIRRHVATETDETIPGATAVVVAMTAQGCVHVVVGDCRLYHFRSGQALYRSRDQTFVQILLDAARITPAEALIHPMRNQVLSCIGGTRDRSKFDPSPYWHVERDGAPAPVLTLQDGDRLVLCSDGVWGELDRDLSSLVLDAPDPLTAVQAVRDAVLSGPATDNLSIIVLDVQSVRRGT